MTPSSGKLRLDKKTSPRSEAQKQGGNFMPQNGETNRKFGFFKNLCCGKEIVVPAGSQFADCPNDRGLTTIWKSLVNDNIVQLGETKSHGCQLPILSVGDRVTFVGWGKQRGMDGGVVEVIEGSLDRYQVRLNDGTSIRCLGFELQLIRGASSKSA